MKKDLFICTSVFLILKKYYFLFINKNQNISIHLVIFSNNLILL